jgi:hypothetical protein
MTTAGAPEAVRGGRARQTTAGAPEAVRGGRARQ